jgi:hypothetical protein
MGGWQAVRLFLAYNESYDAPPNPFLPLVGYLLLFTAIYFFIFRRPKSGTIERQNDSKQIISQELVANETIPVTIGQNTTLGNNFMQPFTCKSCGASNQKSFDNVCDFCGSNGPAIKSAPPLPVNTIQRAQESTISDQLVLVSAAGYVCLDCNSYTSDPDIGMPGSIILEVALYFCYIVPGIIYSIWRRTQHVRICKMCQKNKLIEIMSPEGRVLFKRKYGKYPRFS